MKVKLPEDAVFLVCGDTEGGMENYVIEDIETAMNNILIPALYTTSESRENQRKDFEESIEKYGLDFGAIHPFPYGFVVVVKKDDYIRDKFLIYGGIEL